jgi:anti-anti-sigma factor
MNHPYIEEAHERRWVAAELKQPEKEPVANSPVVTVENETFNGIPVLRCSGRIVYGPESERFFEAIRKSVQTFPTLILDFRHISMIDAKGVGALLTLHALARSKNGSIRLVHVTERVGRVLRITNLFGLFQLYDSEAVALRAG